MLKRVTNIPQLNLLLLIVIPVFLILLPVEWINGTGIPLCLFKNLTGHECWGCGITRAMVCAAKFDFVRAWQFNPLIVAVFPLSIAVWIVAIRRAFIALQRRNILNNSNSHNPKK